MREKTRLLFSLVSTIFNEAKRLRQTIADLEAQTIKPAEIIITDAGSYDNSWEILTEWQKNSAVPIVQGAMQT
ncbi:MAG: glycosyltransferase family 2 protein [Bacteroidales bacterium]|nr:glycosyltransferase family 2 protein [Bacteroidales bacterium]